MSKNSKNARRQQQEDALPKNRSAAARARRASGSVQTAPRSGNRTKKHAWFQTGDRSYSTFIKGGNKRQRKVKEEIGTVEVAIEV